MFTAYFDESETQNALPRHFLLSGYVGDEEAWTVFEERWFGELRKDGFEKHGIHWTDLAGGYGDFAALAGPKHAAEREDIQRRYLAIINSSRIAGLFSAFDMADYARAVSTLEKLRIDKNWPSPYLHAFESVIGRLCTQLKNAGLLKLQQKIAFVFDQKKEIEGKAKWIYDGLKVSNDISYSEHLGTIAFGDRREVLPLQASDVLANELIRDLRRGSSARRWQLETLLDGGQVHEFTFTSEMFDEFAALVRDGVETYLAEQLAKGREA